MTIPEIENLSKEAQGAFFVLDLNKVKQNFLDFQHAGEKYYNNFKVAYSYKTNYAPAICKLLNELGAFAEVVSESEYMLAKKINVASDKIIVNGPLHSKQFIHSLLKEEVVIHFDSFYQIKYLEKIIQENQDAKFKVGLRLNFDISDDVSRFGFYIHDKSFAEVVEKLNSLDVQINSLHCHFCEGARDAQSYRRRALEVLKVYEFYFEGKQIDYINLGGGFYSNMPDSLKEQFNISIPTFEEYASAMAHPIKNYFADKTFKPTLLIEPGGALVTDAMEFYSTVIDVKNIKGKKFALIDGSVYDVKPTKTKKNLPCKVFSLSKDNKSEESYDIVGFTCMEDDIIHRNYLGNIEPGDIIMFSNVGGYTNVLKPPFINPARPIYSKDVETFSLVRKKETFDDLFKGYIF